MKRITLILILLTGICSYTMAQSAMTKDTASKSKKNGSSGTTKAGNPDMRFKANKETKAKQDVQSTPATSTSPAGKTANPPVQSTPASTSGDKVVGKDSKGRSIYQGPKGGQYIINSSGNKEYIKK